MIVVSIYIDRVKLFYSPRFAETQRGVNFKFDILLEILLLLMLSLQTV